jgi:hypothetical protein
LTAAVRLEMQLGRLTSLEPVAQRAALSKAIMQYGSVGTASRTGLSLTEILAKLGGEQGEAEAVAKLKREMAELVAKPAAERTAEQRAALRFASAGETTLLNLDGLSHTEQVAAIVTAIDHEGVAAAIRASCRPSWRNGRGRRRPQRPTRGQRRRKRSLGYSHPQGDPGASSGAERSSPVDAPLEAAPLHIGREKRAAIGLSA